MYPPHKHMLRDLGLRLERGGRLVDRVVVPAPVETRAAHGGVRAGILATAVDVVAAGAALRSLAPDWLATTELSLWTRATEQIGPIAGTATVLRSGRSNAVIEVDLVDEGAERRPVALASATFARIRRPDNVAATTAEAAQERVAVDFANPQSGLRAPFADTIDAVLVDAAAGIVELPRSEYTINSFGSLQGGMVALLAELAAEAAASDCGETRHAVLDLSLRYLEAGPTGPYRTRAAVLRRDGDRALARIEIHDAGAGRCMAVATAGTRAVG